MLKFIEILETRSSDNHVLWLCECDCGNKSVYFATHVRNEKRTKCKKCAIEDARIKNQKHGMKYTKTYASWQAMKSRCLCETSKDYEKYGKRGIKICEEWINSFEKFFEDMGERPNGCSIERINNQAGYFKENCKWASGSEQQTNKSSSYFYKIKGIDFVSMNDAALHFKVSKPTIYKWVNGWFDKRRNKKWEKRSDCERVKKY